MMELNCLCDIYSGYAFKSFNDTSDGIPVIKIGNILSDGTIELTDCVYTEEVPKEKYYSKKDDIYIALSGATTGKIGVMQTDGLYVINQRVGIIRNKGKIPNDYLKYFLVSKSNQILKEASGCAQPNISPKQISKYDISIQTEEKMLLITQQLKKIEVILQNYRNQIDLLDELVKARFVEMFGDPLFNPKSFPIRRIDEVAYLNKGITYSPEDVSNEGLIVLRSSNIKGNKFDLEDLVFIKKEVKLGKMVHENDILMCNRNGSARLVGKVAMIPKLNANMTFGTFMTIIRSELYIYLFNYFQTEAFRQQIRFQTSVSINQISLPLLASVKVPIPPIELQNQFANFVKEVDKSRLEVQKSLKKTQELFDSLIQKYFG